jgi:predicted nucleic acid-binding protein
LRFSAILDANVIYPVIIRDVLLEFALHGLFKPLWSDLILEEVSRTLVHNGKKTVESAAAFVVKMNQAFPDSRVSNFQHAIESGLCRDPDDEHVLAAARASNAGALVTFNLKDFPKNLFEDYGIELVHPDDFLLNLFDLDMGASLQALGGLLGYYKLPPRNSDELCVRLNNAGVAEFADHVRKHSVELDSLTEQVRSVRADSA